MIQCNHPDRRKWKQRTVVKIREVMAKWNTEEMLSDTFNSALTEWMDNGVVDHSEHPEMHQVASHSQWKIGWKHVFTGHLSQEWELLQGDATANQKILKATDWAADPVTCIMNQVTLLWEIRNEEVHGKNANEQTTKLLNRQKQTIATMIELKDKCLARDHHIFPKKPENLLNETSTTKLANWIATRTQVIKASIKQAIKRDVQRTNPITTWFKSMSTILSPEVQWHWDRLLHDPFNKKKRHKQSSPNDSSNTPKHQTTLKQFFSQFTQIPVGVLCEGCSNS